MERITDRIQEIMQKRSGTCQKKSSYDDMTPQQYEQYKIDGLNATPGDLDKQDGYDCKLCKNKGYTMKLITDGRGYNQAAVQCRCMRTRSAINRMNRSGLKDVIRDLTFDKFEAKSEWQKVVKDAAMDYVKNSKGWFYIGGQPGCGKTHLCTAISREFLLSGKDLRYMQWREDVQTLKGLTGTQEQRAELMERLKKAEVLYIDDFFKTGRNQDGSEQRPTGADVNVAFELLNYRYNNPKSLTIISSELTAADVLEIDEAVGSRIYEKSKPLQIARDQKKNYRIKDQVIL